MENNIHDEHSKMQKDLEALQEGESRVVTEIIRLNERMDQMVTKDEFNSKMNTMQNTLDKMIVMMEKRDAEVDALALNQRRMQNQLDTHETEIGMIKTQLKAA